LRLLRAEKDKLESKHREELLQAERTNKEDKTQMRLLDEKLHDEQRKAMQVLEELRSHVCALYVPPGTSCAVN
jgi:myosin protein heavy chain